jgi:ABC-type cobalamin/Fe3+-siderophores transport system ATPase subunit
MSDTLLRIEGLRVAAGTREIVHVEHLAVAAGEVLAILGPNGAGKSTLLRVCLGFQRPSAGRVELLGRGVHTLGTLGLARLRREVGYVPQALAGHSQMPLTLREVVAIGRAGRVGLGWPLGRADWHMVDDWIDRLGLAPLRDRAYADLSGGEQRKGLLARAMVQQPRVLLLDEPTAYLDLGWREQIVGTLDWLCEKSGVTLILVCHELEVLPKACRRLVLLERGRISADGAPADVVTAERIAALYGPGLRVMHEGGRHAVVPRGGDA